MGLVQPQPAGARRAAPRFSSGDVAPALSARLLPQRSALYARISVWHLRLRLLITPADWIGLASQNAIAAFDKIGHAVEALSWNAFKSAVLAIRWRNVALAASAPFVLPSEWRAALVRILAYFATIGSLSLIAAELVRPPAAIATMEPIPRPVWIEVERPWPAFQLVLPNIADDGRYAIRRHTEGSGRKDILSFGELGKTQRFMSFEIYRAGHEITGFGPAAEEVRTLAAEQGRVTGLRGGMPIPSKFGDFTTFEFAIGPFSGYQCVGFLRSLKSPRVQIGGLSCNMKLLVDRGTISCALDKLDLVAAGSDPEIARLFAQAELKRSFCGQREPLMYATPKRPGDVMNSFAERPRLRGRFTR